MSRGCRRDSNSADESAWERNSGADSPLCGGGPLTGGELSRGECSGKMQAVPATPR